MFQGLSRIPGRFIPHRPEEPVLGKQDTQHRLFTAVREVKDCRSILPPRFPQPDICEALNVSLPIWTGRETWQPIG